MNTYIVTNARTGQRFTTRAQSFGEALSRVQTLFGWTRTNVVINKGV